MSFLYQQMSVNWKHNHKCFFTFNFHVRKNVDDELKLTEWFWSARLEYDHWTRTGKKGQTSLHEVSPLGPCWQCDILVWILILECPPLVFLYHPYWAVSHYKLSQIPAAKIPNRGSILFFSFPCLSTLMYCLDNPGKAAGLLTLY